MEDLRCAGCDQWYDEEDGGGECPWCGNENVSEVRCAQQERSGEPDHGVRATQ